MAGLFQGRKAAEFLNATEELSGVAIGEPDGIFRSLSNRKQVLLFVVAMTQIATAAVRADPAP